jgi:hypothetical protein
MVNSLPGTYERCMSGHFYACVRGDEECPICDRIQKLEAENSRLKVAVEESAELVDQRTELLDKARNEIFRLKEDIQTAWDEFRALSVRGGRATADRDVEIARLTRELEEARLESLGLRFRLHRIEGHNQYFFRCENSWCWPNAKDFVGRAASKCAAELLESDHDVRYRFAQSCTQPTPVAEPQASEATPVRACNIDTPARSIPGSESTLTLPSFAHIADTAASRPVASSGDSNRPSVSAVDLVASNPPEYKSVACQPQADPVREGGEK